jgi:hypothetical protein
MGRLWREASSLATSTLTIVEVRSALVRATRSRCLTPRGFRAAKNTAALLAAELYLVETDHGLLDDAAEFAERHVLRAIDAVHLASALALRDPEVVIATWDRELRTAATAEGLRIAA